MEPQEFLREWAYHYAQHLAVFHANEDVVERGNGSVVVRKESGKVTYEPADDLKGYHHRAPQAKETIYVVTLNTEHNLDALVGDWKAFAQHRNVIIIFLNPRSKLDTKWTIHPFVHNRICDEKSLRLGLKSMFANVDRLRKEDLGKLKI